MAGDRNEKLMKHFQLERISNDVFRNVGLPWSHGHNHVIPGAYSLPQIALTAYMTLPAESGLAITCLQSHFIAPGITDIPLVYRVDSIKTSASSALRSIRVEQNDKVILLSTATFSKINNSSSRPAITHSVERQVRTPLGGWKIHLNDFEKTEAGTAGLRAERLPVHRPKSVPSPATDVVPILLQVAPSTLSNDVAEAEKAHLLILAGLSDLYVLDGPISVHGLSYGIPAIGDHTRTYTKPDTDFLISTSHTVYFHLSEGFRTDEILQVEVNSPWAKNGRVFIESRIFQGEGRDGLVATSVQEGLIILKKKKDQLAKI